MSRPRKDRDPRPGAEPAGEPTAAGAEPPLPPALGPGPGGSGAEAIAEAREARATGATAPGESELDAQGRVEGGQGAGATGGAQPGLPPPEPPRSAPSEHGGDGDDGRREVVYRTNWFAMLVAALVGGGVVAGLAYYYYDTRLRMPDPALVSRLTELEQRVGSLGERAPGVEATVADLGSRLDTAAQELQALAQRFAAAGTVTDVSERLDQTGQTLQRLQQDLETVGQEAAGVAPQLEQATGQLRQQVTALGEQLSQLRERVGSLPTSQPDVAPLAQGLGEARSEIEALRTAVEARLQELGRELADTRATGERAVTEAAATAGAAIEENAQRIVALEKELGAAAAAAEEKAAGLQRELEAVRLVGERAAQLALAIGDADQALAQGEPLAAPLQALQALATDDEVLARPVQRLAAIAGQAPASTQDLKQRLDAIRPEGSPRPARQGGGWAGRALGNVESLVNVERTDQAARAAQEAVELAQSRLADGDLEGARDALAPLARTGNEPAARWVADAETRLAAEAALGELRARLQAMLAAAS